MNPLILIVLILLITLIIPVELYQSYGFPALGMYIVTWLLISLDYVQTTNKQGLKK